MSEPQSSSISAARDRMASGRGGLARSNREPSDRRTMKGGDSMRRARILVCSAGVPHESEGASVVLFFHYIRRLHVAGYDIRHLLLLEGSGWSDAAVSGYAAKMRGPGRFEIEAVRSTQFVTHGWRGHKLDHVRFAEAAEKAASFAPDLIVAFDILPALVTANTAARARIVWLGDLHFQSYFWHALYAVTEDIRAARRLPSSLLACRDWKKVYGSVLRNFDQVIVSSASSCGQLRRLGIASEYEPYPWPETVTSRSDQVPSGPPTFLFFGNLVGLGSRSALHFMVERVYPRLLSLWGTNGFAILLAGRGNLPDWFRRKIVDKPEFQALGFVDDLEGVMARCHAVIAPISAPVGNRSRILTAMAKGALVIAHKNAALGNPALVDGDTCYLAHDGEGFVRRMRLAVEDREASRAIVARARRCYLTNFHPDVASGKLLERVDQLVASIPESAATRVEGV